MRNIVGRLRQALRGERGSTSVLIVGMAVALIIGIALAVDGSRKAQSASHATSVAEEAARAGGQALRNLSLAQGQDADVDPQRAAEEARRYLNAVGAAGTVTVDGNRLTVRTTITERTVFLGMIGIGEFTVHGQGAAELVSSTG